MSRRFWVFRLNFWCAKQTTTNVDSRCRRHRPIISSNYRFSKNYYSILELIYWLSSSTSPRILLFGFVICINAIRISVLDLLRVFSIVAGTISWEIWQCWNSFNSKKIYYKLFEIIHSFHSFAFDDWTTSRSRTKWRKENLKWFNGRTWRSE